MWSLRPGPPRRSGTRLVNLSEPFVSINSDFAVALKVAQSLAEQVPRQTPQIEAEAPGPC